MSSKLWRTVLGVRMTYTATCSGVMPFRSVILGFAPAASKLFHHKKFGNDEVKLRLIRGPGGKLQPPTIAIMSAVSEQEVRNTRTPDPVIDRIKCVETIGRKIMLPHAMG